MPARFVHLLGWAVILAGFFVLEGPLALVVVAIGLVITATTGVLMSRETWRELLRERSQNRMLPLFLLAAGFVFGLAAIWIGGGADIPGLQILLVPSGLLIALAGVLLATDYGGSVDWMMEIFWRRQFGRLPMVEGRLGRFQMRGIGVFMVVLGAAWAAGGVYVFVDRIA